MRLEDRVKNFSCRSCWMNFAINKLMIGGLTRSASKILASDIWLDSKNKKNVSPIQETSVEVVHNRRGRPKKPSK